MLIDAAVSTELIKNRAWILKIKIIHSGSDHHQGISALIFPYSSPVSGGGGDIKQPLSKRGQH